MSIFSALSLEDLRTVAELAKHSPEAFAALAVTGVIAVLAIGLVVSWTARHVGGFYAHVEEEEEEAAREEERQGAPEDAAASRKDRIESRALEAEEPSEAQ